jgi:hypothetical protein
MNMSAQTRRGFLMRTLAAGAAARVWQPNAAHGQPAAKSHVILVRDPAVMDAAGQIQPDVVASMLDRAVVALTGKKKAQSAWKALFEPSDVVGIKSNAWRFLPTPPAVEQAIKQRLLDIGCANEAIAIDDRGVRRNPVFQKATAFVNTRPMRTHHWSGVGSLIKNYIMFVPNPADYHGDACADLATIWNQPSVRGKTRLNVLVLLTPLFHSVGLHGFSAEHMWRYNGLAVGVDPVAVDAVGLRVIEAKRRVFFGDDRPLSPPARHIALADTRHHLGNSDPNKIDLVVLGDKTDLLI